MEQVYSVAQLSNKEQVDDFEKVAYTATVYLTTKETFEHTYDTVEMSQDTYEPIEKTVTENKTVDHFQQFDVEFDTSSLDPLMFTAWEDLTEEQVVAWVKSAKDVTPLETEGAAIVTEKKDRILNPKKYQINTPPTPWRVRADQEARAAAEAETAVETTEETN